MKKKIFISFITLIFFLSTTSLPVSIHLCKMMGTIAVEECAMCAAKKQVESKLCCSAKTKSDINIKAEISSSCCSTKLIDASVKDNYISNKIGFQELNSIKLLKALALPEEIFQINTTIQIFKDNPPPLRCTNDIYLYNSILLI